MLKQPTYEELFQRVKQFEAQNAERDPLLASNQPHVVWNEIAIPLEIITNLVFLLGQEKLSEAAYSYVRLLDEQLALVTSACTRSYAL